MANDNRSIGSMATNPSIDSVVTSAVHLRQQLDSLLANRGSARAPLRIHVRGDVDADVYLSIVRALAQENRSRGRQDTITSLRQAPYDRLPTLFIRSVRQLESTFERLGTAFCCLPTAADWDEFQAIMNRAHHLDVQIDSWSLLKQ